MKTLRRFQEWAATKIPHNIYYIVDFSEEWESERRPRLRAKFIFAWYDMWIGVFVERNPDKPAVYIFPVPCFGLKIFIG